MLGRGRLNLGALVLVLVLALVAAAVLVSTKMGARLGLMKATAVVMAGAVAARVSIKGWGSRHVGSGGRIALVRRRVLCGRSGGSGVRVWSAHWSGCRRGRTGIKSHANRRAHHLPLVSSPIVVAATPATPAAVSAMSRCSLRLGRASPLGSGMRIWWGSRRVGLAVGRLGRRLVLGLGAVRRLLLVDLGGVVGVVVLGRQRGMRRGVRGVLLGVLGMPLLLLLRRRRLLLILGLGRRAGVGGGIRRAVCGLLGVAVGVGRMGCVVAASIGAAPASAAVAAARRAVRRVATRGARLGRRRGRRRGPVVVRHGSSRG